jgi:hypothetical protein
MDGAERSTTMHTIRHLRAQSVGSGRRKLQDAVGGIHTRDGVLSSTRVILHDSCKRLSQLVKEEIALKLVDRR